MVVNYPDPWHHGYKTNNVSVKRDFDPQIFPNNFYSPLLLLPCAARGTARGTARGRCAMLSSVDEEAGGDSHKADCFQRSSNLRRHVLELEVSDTSPEDMDRQALEQRLAQSLHQKRGERARRGRGEETSGPKRTPSRSTSPQPVGGDAPILRTRSRSSSPPRDRPSKTVSAIRSQIWLSRNSEARGQLPRLPRPAVPGDRQDGSLRAYISGRPKSQMDSRKMPPRLSRRSSVEDEEPPEMLRRNSSEPLQQKRPATRGLQRRSMLGASPEDDEAPHMRRNCSEPLDQTRLATRDLQSRALQTGAFSLSMPTLRRVVGKAFQDDSLEAPAAPALRCRDGAHKHSLSLQEVRSGLCVNGDKAKWQTQVKREQTMDKYDRVKLAIQRKLERARRSIENEEKDQVSRGGAEAKSDKAAGASKVQAVGKAVSVLHGWNPLAFESLKSLDPSVDEARARLGKICLSASTSTQADKGRDVTAPNYQEQPDVDLLACEEAGAGMEMSDAYLEGLMTSLQTSHLFVFPEHNETAFRAHAAFLSRQKSQKPGR